MPGIIDGSMRSSYQPRSIRFVELYEALGWRLKIYSILHSERVLDQELFSTAKETALAFLPQPAITKSHYGVGFLSAHRGSSYDFVTIAYWSYETELRFQTYMRPSSDSYQLEALTASELSNDVWDLKLLAFEREAWVDSMLQREKPDLDAYLSMRLSEVL
ncbi:MAG: hypothetical protein JSV66_17955 [Trueperaceae bacterium]|nr:MAG: hypothetical protein JSV66_17955 [Trueperaceae bacterium]